MSAAIASEPIGCTRAQHSGHNTGLQVTRMAIAPKWRSQVSITPVTSSQDQMYEVQHVIEQFRLPVRMSASRQKTPKS